MSRSLQDNSSWQVHCETRTGYSCNGKVTSRQELARIGMTRSLQDKNWLELEWQGHLRQELARVARKEMARVEMARSFRCVQVVCLHPLLVACLWRWSVVKLISIFGPPNNQMPFKNNPQAYIFILIGPIFSNGCSKHFYLTIVRNDFICGSGRHLGLGPWHRFARRPMSRHRSTNTWLEWLRCLKK